MANRQVFNNVSQCADYLQQISLSPDPNKNTMSAHINNLNRSSRVNSQVQTVSPTHQRDREHIPKIRKKPRHRNRHKKGAEDISRNSVSSDCSHSSSIVESVSSPRSSNASNKKYTLNVSPSSSKTPVSSKMSPVTFSIKPVNNNTHSRFIRQRNIVQKFINLRSFLNKSSTCLFITGVAGFMHFKKTPDKKKLSASEKKKTEQKIKEVFIEYMSENDIVVGLSNGTLVKGFIRINPKNPRESYVSNTDSSIADYCITSIGDRNRALEGDEVVLEIQDKEPSAQNTTAKVVYIKQKIHRRTTVGLLKWVEENGENFALFVPRDKRFPHMRISELYVPTGFKDNPKQFQNVLFVGKLVEWIEPSYAKGILIEKLGESGNLQVESLSILKENNLDVSPFREEILDNLPDFRVIPQKEYEYREDLRKKCIFTIDPETARDLDDAVSVEILSNGNLEVGVHISDASFYLEEGTELDQVVSQKATTIYLVDKAYHMLPIELCLACSLLPGEDKLAFSVFWEMTQAGEVLNTRFTRSIVNSCAKLAYEHAQKVIENPDKEFTTDDFPHIYNGFEPKDLVKTINILQSIAIILRENRIKNGALRIDNIKLHFDLHPATGEPLSYSLYENKESHRLIEEFMLLANISVAQKIRDDFPDIAFLRCHEEPKGHMLIALQNKLAKYGIHLDISSSGALAESLKKYFTDDFIGKSRAVVLNLLTSKAMIRAQYFCASAKETQDEYKHYALSVPIYTHFTSPIRRYADIMVHRLLAASLDYIERPKWDLNYVEAIASNCNTQKYNAKKAGDTSIDLYLAHYIENHLPCKEDCVVVEVRKDKFDVVVLKTGSIVRIYANNCSKSVWSYDENKLDITFPKTTLSEAATISVDMFALVKIHLRRKDSYHLQGRLERPRPPRPRKPRSSESLKKSPPSGAQEKRKRPRRKDKREKEEVNNCSM